MITMEGMVSWMVRRNEGESNALGCHDVGIMAHYWNCGYTIRMVAILLIRWLTIGIVAILLEWWLYY